MYVGKHESRHVFLPPPSCSLNTFSLTISMPFSVYCRRYCRLDSTAFLYHKSPLLSACVARTAAHGLQRFSHVNVALWISCSLFQAASISFEISSVLSLCSSLIIGSGEYRCRPISPSGVPHAHSRSM